MNNNNYIAWLYIRGIPEYIARARAIYSGIPLIAMQYNISVRGTPNILIFQLFLEN